MLTVKRKARRDLWTSELRCATGRSAIRHLMGRAAVEGVVVPCYVPEGVIDPIKDAGMSYQFYRLGRDLMPDLDDLESILAATHARLMILVIHYFGFEAAMEEIRTLADRYDALIFEDCAHAWWARAEYADVALWSANKFFPVVDGAIMRTRGIDVAANPQYPLPDKAIEAYRRHLSDNSDEAYEEFYRVNRSYEEYYRIIRAAWLCRPTQEFDLLFTANAEYVKDEQLTRLDNRVYYEKCIPDEYKLHDERQRSCGLFAYPIACPMMPQAVTNELRRVGVYALTSVDKWDHIPREDRYSNELHFLAHHLLLPVSSGVTRNDIIRIGDCLRRFAKMENVA